MNKTANTVLALTTPVAPNATTPTADAPAGMDGDQARAFLTELITDRKRERPIPPPAVNMVIARTEAKSTKVDLHRTPAPIRFLKDEGIIGVA